MPPGARDSGCRSPRAALGERGQVAGPALGADPAHLDPWVAILEALLVGGHAEHALEVVVGELRDPTAALADEVLVRRRGGCRLEGPEPLAEVVLPHQAALHQEVEGAVEGRDADRLASCPEPALQIENGGVVPRAEQLRGDGDPLAGHRKAPVPQQSPEALREGLRLIRGRAGTRARDRPGPAAPPRRSAWAPARAARPGPRAGRSRGRRGTTRTGPASSP